MARRRYRRRYIRKGRWSANINNINGNFIFQEGSTSFLSVDLQTNPAQTSSTVSQQYTVKNVEMTYEVEATTTYTSNQIENLQAYIIYVPQGMVVTETLPFNHPEYIMAYRWLGSADQDGSNVYPGRNPLFIKSRLSRRLQTGDRIIFLLIGNNTASADIPVNVRGLVRYWTKAN